MSMPEYDEKLPPIWSAKIVGPLDDASTVMEVVAAAGGVVVPPAPVLLPPPPPPPPPHAARAAIAHAAKACLGILDERGAATSARDGVWGISSKRCLMS